MVTFKWNYLAVFNVVMTSHLILMTVVGLGYESNTILELTFL